MNKKNLKEVSWHEDLQKELLNPRFKKFFEEEQEKVQIAYEIALLRHAAKLTQKELAQKLKISQSAIARIESGEQNLTLDTLMKIGALFGKKLQVKFI